MPSPTQQFLALSLPLRIHLERDLQWLLQATEFNKPLIIIAHVTVCSRVHNPIIHLATAARQHHVVHHQPSTVTLQTVAVSASDLGSICLQLVSGLLAGCGVSGFLLVSGLVMTHSLQFRLI